MHRDSRVSIYESGDLLKGLSVLVVTLLQTFAHCISDLGGYMLGDDTQEEVFLKQVNVSFKQRSE